jgi:hypothetical protein
VRSPRPGRRASQWATIAVVGVAGCGASLRLVPVGPHATDAATIVVSTPPPPAKVETVTTDPGAPCAWQDGRWDWVDQTWEWVPGGWVVPPDSCHYAYPEAVWVPAVAAAGKGVLFYLPGRWYRESGTAPCTAPKSCNPASPNPA